MFIDYLWPELKDMNLDDMYSFNQGGATNHTTYDTIDLLKNKFDERVISRNGIDNWPPRSYDLTPLNIFLWGYANKPTTLEELRANIEREMLQTCSRWLYEQNQNPFINVLIYFKPINKFLKYLKFEFYLKKSFYWKPLYNWKKDKIVKLTSSIFMTCSWWRRISVTVSEKKCPICKSWADAKTI